MKSAVGESVVSQPVMAKVEQVVESSDSKMTVLNLCQSLHRRRRWTW